MLRDVAIVGAAGIEAVMRDDASPDRVRLYSGYSGWGPGQLEREIARGDWRLGTGAADVVFSGEQAERLKNLGMQISTRESGVSYVMTPMGSYESRNTPLKDKRVRLADANAKAVGGEATAQADIAAAQATLAVKKAEAYQLAETKKREAEAAVLEAQNRAMAKAALADAAKIEAEQRAALGAGEQVVVVGLPGDVRDE